MAYGARLDRAQEALRDSGAAALVLGLGADLRYLTGYTAHPLERLTALIVRPGGTPVLIAPRLEAMAAAASPAGSEGLVEVASWDETDDPYALVAKALRGGPKGQQRILVDPGLPSRHLLALQSAVPGAAFGLSTEVLQDLRAVKSTEEVSLLRRAAHAADRVVARIAAGPLAGRTELEISREVGELLVEEGHDAVSFAIVASGPNGASPHHAAGERRIGAGDPIVLDIGGTLDGYGSDITRMLWVTGGSVQPTAEFMAAFDLVRRAQAAATAAVRPGIRCSELDEVARAVIREGGRGEEFVHRLGHGIGLEAHEEPYLVGGNDARLRVGNAFSIEPGVYPPGRFGIRLEDIVVCGDDGPDVLNQAPLDLLVVDG